MKGGLQKRRKGSKGESRLNYTHTHTHIHIYDMKAEEGLFQGRMGTTESGEEKMGKDFEGASKQGTLSIIYINIIAKPIILCADKNFSIS